MGILGGSGGDTEGTWSFSSEKEVKESAFCRTQRPEYRSGVWGRGAVCGFRRGQGKGSIYSPRPSSCITAGRVPDALGIPSRCWRRGSRFPGEVLTLGTDDLPGCLSGLSAVAVWVCIHVRIRELLAAPTEILLLTANARRGCFHGNTGQ